MAFLNEAVLSDPERLAAVARARRVLPAQAIPLDAIAQMAARLTSAPIATVTLVDDQEEYFVGVHGLPEPFREPRRAPLAYSLCKYVVSQDHPISSGDMRRDSAELCEHLLTTEFGVRAFLAVPVRDNAGRPVGSLTVVDTVVRQWNDDQLTALLEIAEVLRPPPTAATTPGVEGLDSAALLDSVQEAFLAVNPDGVVVGFNRAARDLLGFTAAEVCGRPLQDQLLPDYDGQPISAAIDRLFAAAPDRPVTRQVNLCHRDGHRLPANVSLSVVRGASGALACAFLTDLSAQAAAEATAERHQNFLAALLESLDVGVIACDTTGRVVVMNKAIRKVRGLPLDGDIPEDLPASAANALLDTDLRPLPWERTPLMRAWHGEHVEGADVVVRRPGHRLRTFACTAQLITGNGGQRLGAVAVAHEVTSLRRTERFRACHRAVDEALKAARSATEAAPAILEAVTTALNWPCAELFLIDELTDTLRPVGHWHTTGIDPDGFFGHTPRYGTGITGRVWATGQAMWVPDIAHSPQLTSAYEESRVEVCVRNGIRTVLAVPVRDGGTLLGVLTCYADAPERHEDLLTVLLDGVAAQIGVYVALRHAEELARQLTRAQDDFIALVGHEMRTPLTSIAANAGILAEDSDSLDDDHRQMVQTIARNTGLLQKIVETLLDLAGLESGHVALTTEVFDLVETVTAAIAAAQPHAADTGVRLCAELPSRALLRGDAPRLRQVLDDLLSNAVKYSPSGGDVHVSLTLDDDTVQVCVADTGIGTPTTERARVFDRFFRGSNVRHHGTTGSGLGLSLARTIIALHQGTIRLTDNEPTGTVVCVRLPVGDVPTSA
ncbi:ATP-binding protein [Actinoplanes sp. NEAU-A12]|uniref:histidine kinase n=1 Tax=Actinoplanes sandaracinus TaxID=3045177 RepID=A0ABT6X165_9ACTN|nr:ATP-binding protein [Actinoplanes sandaracinus]MDI6105751.1 ATP-binding protein [Actinoplanes sandaracinus]